MNDYIKEAEQEKKWCKPEIDRVGVKWGEAKDVVWQSFFHSLFPDNAFFTLIAQTSIQWQ